MLFNSLQFLIFFQIVILTYFITPYRHRWILLLSASYYFYMCWNPAYILLIMVSTVTAYSTALLMERTAERGYRKTLLVLSLTVNLGILFGFKYFNFFNTSAKSLFENFNLYYDIPALKVLLPVGISFYTFQVLSYSIDVYQKKQKAEKHFGIFALYVAFFPQLVAGPIERSTRLLPQFYQKNDFDLERFKSGLLLILWGFFKKLVIADRLAVLVNQIYNSPYDYQGFPLIIATYFFAFQIYCDFSGYSDIAVGSARIMGYDIMINFKQPYFVKSIADFWRRWHISLSTWFRDYLYIPLGGNRVNQARWHYNIFIVFLLSGLWHGANWTFLFWGMLHGIYIITGRITRNYRINFINYLGITKTSFIRNLLSYLITFHLIVFAWIFFRANNLSEAFYIILNLFSEFKLQFNGFGLDAFEFKVSIILITLLMLVDFSQKQQFSYQIIIEKSKTLKWGTYYLLVMGILLLGKFGKSQFIYFRF